MTKWVPAEWAYSDGRESELNNVSKLLYQKEEANSAEYAENTALFLEAVTEAWRMLIADKIFIFNVAQTFSSKTFVIDLPDETNEHTWTLRFQLSSANPSVIFTAPSGYTLKWANNETPIFNGNGSAYEITFKYIPGVKLLLGVCGEF